MLLALLTRCRVAFGAVELNICRRAQRAAAAVELVKTVFDVKLEAGATRVCGVVLINRSCCGPDLYSLILRRGDTELISRFEPLALPMSLS